MMLLIMTLYRSIFVLPEAGSVSGRLRPQALLASGAGPAPSSAASE